MESMADEYVKWDLSTAEGGLGGTYRQPEDAVIEGVQNVLVVDMFCKHWLSSLEQR